MAINGVGHNYDYLGTTTNYIRGKATVREAISKMVKQSANLSISDAGRNMLREMERFADCFTILGTLYRNAGY